MSNAKPQSSKDGSSTQNPSQKAKIYQASSGSSESSESSSSSQKGGEQSPWNLSPWNQLAVWQRQQLTLATECASVMFRGVESMRRVQQEAAHQMSAQHAAITEQLRSAEQLADLLPLLSTPMRIDMESVEQYWKQLAGATLQAQVEMMNSVCQMFSSENNTSVPSMQKVIQAAIAPMANSFFVDGAHDHERPHHA